MPYTTAVAGTTITAAAWNASVRDQGVTPFASTTARDAAITSPIEGMVTYQSDSDTLTVYNGSAWVTTAQLAGWTSFTPTLTQNSNTITKTVTYAKYIRFGRTIVANCRLDLTGTVSGGSQAVLVGLPVTAATTSLLIGDFYYYDASAGAGTPYLAAAFNGTTTSCYGIRDSAAANAGIGTSPALSATSSDIVAYSVMYEAAAST